MPSVPLIDAIRRLDQLASGTIDWKPLQGEQEALQARLIWLRQQWQEIPAPLTAVLAGGTGVGKSTLLNALAGARIAEAGETRPTTQEPTVYHPPGAECDFGPATYVESPHLEGLTLIDTPDTDSVKTEHCERVAQLLGQADVVLFCATQQKYKNEKTLALLRPLKDERKTVCVQTRADQDEDIRGDWLARMEHEGFSVDTCFRVSALHALEAKLEGRDVEDGFEFCALEDLIHKQLPPERARIKEANLAGAVANTLDQLQRGLGSSASQLEALSAKVEETERAIAQDALNILQSELLTEPHVWISALGEGVSERAFGLIGTLYRILHAVRTLPSKIGGRLSLTGLLKPTHGADRTLTEFRGTDDAYLQDLAEGLEAHYAQVNAQLVRAGFPEVSFDAWKADFVSEVRERLQEHLAPVQARLDRRARVLTRMVLPLFEVLWFVPFAATVGVPIGKYYWALLRHAEIALPQADFLSRSASMVAAVVFLELAAFTYLVRTMGRGLRQRSKKDVAQAGETGGFGFGAQRRQIQAALDELNALESLHKAMARH